MKVTQEKLPDSQIGLEIEIPAAASKKVYENVVKKLSRTVNIPGFRRGKVPRAIVVQRLGQGYIKATAIEELIDDSIKAAVKQEELPVIGNFSLRSDMETLIQTFEPDAPLTIKVAADVFPKAEYDPESYKKIAVQAEEIKYNPDSVEEWLKDQRTKRATLVPVEDRAAAMGDVAIVDYAAFALAEDGSQGEAIAEVKGSDFEVKLEEGRFVTGIVDGIVGMAIEEIKLIPVTFPEDYPLEMVAGEDVLFDIHLKEIKFQELPELDDEFAEDVSEFETMAELRADLEKTFQEEAEKRTEANIKEAIKKELASLFTGDLPETMINQECDRLIAQTAMELERMGLDISQIFRQGDDMITTLKQNSRPEAIANLKTQLMIGGIAKDEKIDPTEAEIKERCDELRQEFKGEKVDESRLLNFVESSLLEEKVLDLLKEFSTVELLPEGSLSQSEEEDQADDIIDVTAAESDEAED